MRRLIHCFSYSLFLLLSFGCGGGSDQLPVIPVQGKVLLDGEPAAGAYVEFVPQNSTEAMRTMRPVSSVDENGEFVLSTYAGGDGIPEGEYNVFVRWPTPDEMTEPDSYPENWEALREIYGDPANPRFDATIQKPEDSEIEVIVIPAFELVSDADESEE